MLNYARMQVARRARRQLFPYLGLDGGIHIPIFVLYIYTYKALFEAPEPRLSRGWPNPKSRYSQHSRYAADVTGVALRLGCFKKLWLPSLLLSWLFHACSISAGWSMLPYLVT